ncbi:MAG: prolyl oligopeptidase family serine peptidase [Candidatus Aminicenantales bacterium]
MKTKIIFFILGTGLIGCFMFQPQAGLAAEDYEIFETGKEIVVDGKLEEWKTLAEFPVNFFPDGMKVPPSPDTDVRVKFAYDSRFFYLALIAVDDVFEFPQRAWRYGDGFYLTFVDLAAGNESEHFWSFGFSLEENKKVAVLVNRDGVYFPPFSVENIKMEVSLDRVKNTIVYEIGLPWEAILPLRPFIHSKWGINVIYVDRDREQRKILQLYPDLFYDTEATNKRKAAIFTFVNYEPRELEFQSLLNKSYFLSGEGKILTLAINTPGEKANGKVKVAVSSSQKNFCQEESITLKKGMNLVQVPLEKGNYPSGVYDLGFAIFDGEGKLRESGQHSFLVINMDELDSVEKMISRIKKEKKYVEDSAFRHSFPSLEIRLQWLKEFAQKAYDYADTRNFKGWLEEMQYLLDKVQRGEPALFPKGTLARLAHRSEIDATLQPFSLYVPEVYEDKKPLPLFVTLHGSGVDERQSAYSTVGRLAPAMNQGLIPWMIILAPQARDLSGWYLGASGKDVLECIEWVKKLYKIDAKEIIIDGFSMGGYGAWRLSLLHPEVFHAAIIRSGAVVPPPPLKGEDIFDLIHTPISVSYLAFHGDADNAIPVSQTRRAVEKLQQAGIHHRYIEIKGAGHGNYDPWAEICSWLRTILFNPLPLPSPFVCGQELGLPSRAWSKKLNHSSRRKCGALAACAGSKS